MYTIDDAKKELAELGDGWEPGFSTGASFYNASLGIRVEYIARNNFRLRFSAELAGTKRKVMHETARGAVRELLVHLNSSITRMATNLPVRGAREMSERYSELLDEQNELQAKLALAQRNVEAFRNANNEAERSYRAKIAQLEDQLKLERDQRLRAETLLRETEQAKHLALKNQAALERDASNRGNRLDALESELKKGLVPFKPALVKLARQAYDRGLTDGMSTPRTGEGSEGLTEEQIKSRVDAMVVWACYSYERSQEGKG